MVVTPWSYVSEPLRYKINGIIIHPILLSTKSVQIAPGDRKIKCRICTVAVPTDLLTK